MADYSSSEEFWPALREQALSAVRTGHEPEHVSGYIDHLELQLLTLPSFETVVGWQVHRRQPIIYRRYPTENGGLPRFIATRSAWAQAADAENFSSPVKRLAYLSRLSPNLSFQTAEIDPVETQQLLKTLRGLVLPLFIVDDSIALDGVSYELHHDSNMTKIRLRWWGEGPEEWRPLIDIFISLWSMLEK